MFDALIKRKEAEDKKSWLKIGVIVANVINFSMCHPEKQVSPLDYVPGEQPKPVDLTTMTPEEQAAHIKGQLTKAYKRPERSRTLR